jgi:CDP-diacylglycerol--serine O-phosphatidyltransferase
MKQIPNFFTLLNLFFGCLATIFILQNGIGIMYNGDGTPMTNAEGTIQLVGIPESIWMASLCIGLAAGADFLDGFVARIFKSDSALGKQLDSLGDLVSFGVAPGLILYQFLRMSFLKQVDGLNVSMYWLLPALLIPCAAAYRLAVFNLDTKQAHGFRGIPTPAVGLLIASFPLIYWNALNGWIVSLLSNRWFLYCLIFLLSWGMVSRIPMLAFKFKDYSFRGNIPRWTLLLIGILGALFLKWLAVPLVFLSYIGISLLSQKNNS